MESPFACEKCSKPIELEADVVILYRGKMTDPSSDDLPFGLSLEADADFIAHACCWDGIEDSRYMGDGCEHMAAAYEKGD